MTGFYLFSSLDIAMFLLNVSILLPIAVAVGITLEKHIKRFPCSWKYILQRKIIFVLVAHYNFHFNTVPYLS